MILARNYSGETVAPWCDEGGGNQAGPGTYTGSPTVASMTAMRICKRWTVAAKRKFGIGFRD
jgi:hypothetical protein